MKPLIYGGTVATACVAVAVSGCKHSGPKMTRGVFDIPYLISHTKTLEDVKGVVGLSDMDKKPEWKASREAVDANIVRDKGRVENVDWFRNGQTYMAIDYNPATRQVLYCYLAPRLFRRMDKQELLRFGNLSESDRHYSLWFRNPPPKQLPIVQPERLYTAVKVTPQ